MSDALKTWLESTPAERAAIIADRRAKQLARATPAQLAEMQRVLALAPEKRHAEMLVKEKLKIEEKLSTMTTVLEAIAVDEATPVAIREEVGGFMLRGTGQVEPVEG